MPRTRTVLTRSRSLTIPARLIGLTLAVLVLGGCMSSDGKNDPLPVMARTDAQAWAQHMTEYMAQAAGITLTPSTVNPAFRPCTGRNGERADDDRYYLSYAVDSTVPLQQHPDAVRKIRDMLTGRNFDIKGYREETDGQPDALLDAYDPQGHYLVSAETGGGTDRMLLRIITPCLMPPTTPTPDPAH